MVPAAKFGHGVMQARQLRGIKRRAKAMDHALGLAIGIPGEMVA
jgi:hypothetical protein